MIARQVDAVKRFGMERVVGKRDFVREVAKGY